MPDGIVQWFNEETGEGRIHSGSHDLVVLRHDIESNARLVKSRFAVELARRIGTAASVTSPIGIGLMLHPLPIPHQRCT
jgi:hypothetical protein